MPRPIEDIRQLPRIQAHVWVECPALWDAPFPTEDVSPGGFKAVLPFEPEEGVAYEVKIRLGEAAFGPCSGLVAWKHREDGQGFPQWAFGVLVMMEDEDREAMAHALEELTRKALA